LHEFQSKKVGKVEDAPPRPTTPLHTNYTELTCSKSTEFRDAFVGHAGVSVAI